MSTLVFADNFLAGSLLSLLMPVLLVVALTVAYVVLVKRVPERTPTTSAKLPPPEVTAAVPEGTEQVTPAGPPPGDIA